MKATRGLDGQRKCNVFKHESLWDEIETDVHNSTLVKHFWNFLVGFRSVFLMLANRGCCPACFLFPCSAHWAQIMDPDTFYLQDVLLRVTHTFVTQEFGKVLAFCSV